MEASELAASLFALIVGVGTAIGIAAFWASLKAAQPSPREPTAAARVQVLGEALERTGRAMDAALTELASIAVEKKNEVETLQKAIVNLETEHAEQLEAVAALKAASPAAARAFANEVSRIQSEQERRSVRRDALLLVAGVLLGAMVQVLLRLLGIG